MSVLFADLSALARENRVVRYSFDRGATWTYTKLRAYYIGYCQFECKAPPFHNCIGVPGDREVTPTGVHGVAPIADHYYDNPAFRIELVDDSDAARRSFSYEGNSTVKK